jgi:hypothetical protein
VKDGDTLTAVEEILLAAAELAGDDNSEFSEWELTVQAWKRNRNRFGLHGFEDQYPNHKRVSKEIMNQGPYSPIRQGWMTKVRTNYYRLTPLGLAAAERLKGRVGETVGTARASQNVFDSLAKYIEHRAFRDYCRDPEEPRTWLGAAAFLGITKNEPRELADRICAAENTIKQASAWMDHEKRDTIRRGPVGGSITIRRLDVERLAEFLNVLQSRFELQMGAIRKKSG